MVWKWVSNRWKLKGSVSVIAMARGLFIFKFNRREDMLAILAGGPWLYGTHSLTLCTWRLGFDPSTNLNRSAPV